MAQAVIPFSFESYLQKKLAAGEAVTLNKIVLANIPDLDISQLIPRNTGLPDSKYIVHEQVVDQVGKVNTNALAYSIVMDTQVGDFTFNAMYLIDKDDRTSVGMIVWKLPEDKTATNAQVGTTGNSLVKSMLMEYDGAAQAAAITVDAATWQIDYSARLIGMDEDLRKQALDIYGHDAFIDDGFSVSKATNTDEYHVHMGLGYIGGLRAELSQQQVLTIANKPMSIYAVVSRQGSVLGAWQNTVAIRTSETPLNDHKTDGVQYYVAKIADINSDGSVVDMRSKNPLNIVAMFDKVLLGRPLKSWDRQPRWGFIRYDGTEHKRSDYSKIFNYALNEVDDHGNSLFISQTLKDSDPLKYAAYFGDGDGETTFTTPNGHLGNVFRGASEFGAFLETQEDAIRNIKGHFVIGSGNDARMYAPNTSTSGVFSSIIRNSNQPGLEINGTILNNQGRGVDFTASNTVPTAEENRMKNTNIYIDAWAGE